MTVSSSLIQALCSHNDRLKTLIALKERARASEFEALLKGVQWGPQGWTMGRYFAGTSLDDSYFYQYRSLIAALLLLAPPGCEAADVLAADVSALELSRVGDHPLPLGDGATLRRFRSATTVRLVRFALDDLSALSGLPALRELYLEEGQLPDGLPGLVLRKEVSSLFLLACGLTRLDGLSGPGLRSLQLRGNHLESLDRLPALPELVELSLWYCRYLRSLRGLERFPKLQRLEFTGCEALPDFEGLPPSLSSTCLHRGSLSLRGLKCLAGLPELPGVSRLELTELDNLENIDGIEKLPNLTHLALRGVQKSLDLAPLTKLSKLESLDLRRSPGITSVDALDGMDTLKVLLLCETGVPRRAVRPDLRWRCSWAGRPDIGKLLRDNRPKTDAPVSVRSKMDSESKSSLASLRKVLASGDMDSVRQGLEMLQTLEDASLYDALLEGADYSYARNRGYRVGSSKFSGPTQDYLLHRLIADAPPESVHASALKDKIKELAFVDNTRKGWQPRPFDLTLLKALPKLAHLSFHRYGPLTTSEDLALPALIHLRLSQVQGDLSLSWLAHCPALISLEIASNRGWSGDLSFVSSLTRLARLGLEYQEVSSLEPLQELTSLEQVRLASCHKLSRLDGLGPSLKSLSLTYCNELTSLRPVLEAPALQMVHVYGCWKLPEAELEALAARGVQVSQKRR